jgi:hypothetical protein
VLASQLALGLSGITRRLFPLSFYFSLLSFFLSFSLLSRGLSLLMEAPNRNQSTLCGSKFQVMGMFVVAKLDPPRHRVSRGGFYGEPMFPMSGLAGRVGAGCAATVWENIQAIAKKPTS